MKTQYTFHEREVSYLKIHGLSFNVIEEPNHFGIGTMEIEIKDSSDLMKFGNAIGESKYHQGVRDGKSIFSPSLKHAS